jgi:GT2 family glycosyltransferase
VSVVIATRNRPAELGRTLDALGALRPCPPVIVVDNASDGPLGPAYRHPVVTRLVPLRRNRGAAARTVGARLAGTPYVAFSDDDSWWAPGALASAADALDRHPRLALVAARTLVGPEHRSDPINTDLSASPLPSGDGVPGTAVLGCLACATVVRRAAFLGVGGFRELLLIYGEETLLCYDLAAAGWALRYLDHVVAHHHPSAERAELWRRRALARRNEALIGWMRRPLRVAAGHTWRLVRQAPDDRAARAALAGLTLRLPAALADRRPLPEALERQVRLLERAGPVPVGPAPAGLGE